MKPYNNFIKEIEQLEILHASTLYAYDETILHTRLRKKDGFLDKNDTIIRTLSGHNNFTLAKNLQELHNRYKKDFRVILRETLFVRAISVLEVFLVDTIREILLNRTDLFEI